MLTLIVLPVLAAVLAGILCRNRRDALLISGAYAVSGYAFMAYSGLTTNRPGPEETWVGWLILTTWATGALLLITTITHWARWKREPRVGAEDVTSSRRSEAGIVEERPPSDGPL